MKDILFGLVVMDLVIDHATIKILGFVTKADVI
jgi:hypothetical protein